MAASVRVLFVGAAESHGVLAALAEAGFDVHVEAAPLRACALLRQTTFDAVVAQLVDPGTDALALLRAARRHSPPAVVLFHFARPGRGSAVLETVERAPDTTILTSDEPAAAVDAVYHLLRGDSEPLPNDLAEDGRLVAMLGSIEAASMAASSGDLDALRSRVAASARDAAGGRAAWVVAWDPDGEHIQRVGATAAPPGLAAEVRLARRPLVRHGRGGDHSVLGVPVAVDDAVVAALLVEFDAGIDASGALPLAEALGRLVQLSEANVRLHHRIDGSADALTAALWAALALRGLDAEGHARRVADLASALASSANLGESEEGLSDLRRAALLHDVGKLGVPDAALAGRHLSSHHEGVEAPNDWLLVERMLAGWTDLQGAARLVRSSHEWWDGSGFPDGLAGDEIPVGSRVLAVADAWDRLTSTHRDRVPRSAAAALAEVRGQSAVRFDPMVVAALGALMSARASSKAVEPSSGGLAVA